MPFTKWLSDIFTRRSHHDGDEFPPPINLDLALKDAEELLGYVAEAGVEVAPADVQTIVTAINSNGTADTTAWVGDSAAPLLAAISRIAAKASPVTAETLRASRYVAPRKIRTYELLGFALLIVIITLSYLSFVTDGLSKSISAEIETSNKLVVSLHTELPNSPILTGGPIVPAAAISPVDDLQEFAATARSIRRDTSSLKGYLFYGAREISTVQDDYELPEALLQSDAIFRKALTQSTIYYQGVRRYAKDVQGDTDLYYRALSNVVLTILYALLGAIAYLIRLFSTQVSKCTFSPTYSANARLLVAMIAGLAIGLFNAFTLSAAASLSPLALAFLAGYAADGFFTSLDGLSFKKPT
ncbi:MAG TPA: hypothetical protein VGI19_14965 [Candidatus Cybelea sp.]|jgi:hypothetical protein